MAGSFTTRLGNAPEEGIKAPVVVATQSNITLSGEQTIETVAVTAGQRVLVRAQTDATENGIYNAAAGSWTRSHDWNKADDVINGVLVVDASTSIIYQGIFTGSWVAGTTETAFTPFNTVSPTVETKTLASAQLEVTFTNSIATGAIFIRGPGADNGRLIDGVDYSRNIPTKTITLTDSYPDGTMISLVLNDLSSGEGALGNEFETVAAMTATAVSVGSIVHVKGNAAAGDGGHGPYYIKTLAAYGATPDEARDHTMTGGLNVAVLLSDGPIKLRRLGFAGDGTTDDYAAFVKAAVDNTVLYIESPHLIGTSIDLSGVELVFRKGGSIVRGAGAVITTGSIVAGGFQIFSGSGTTVFTDTTIDYLPEWFGTVGDQVADDATKIQELHDACETNGCTVLFSKLYGIGTKLEWSNNVPIKSSVKALWKSVSANANCIEFADGNYRGRNYVPKIDGFTGFSIKLLGTNACQIESPLISNYGDAVVMETLNATHPSLLDSEVYVHQIGIGSRAFVFSADNNANVMQGNLLRCNFINQSTECVTFASNGLGSPGPNWDSNQVVLQATDPTVSITDAKLLTNENTVAVNRFTFRVEGWCGGMAATAKFMDGNFNDLDAYLNLAQEPTDDMIQVTGTNNRIDVSNVSGTNNSVVTCGTASDKAAFNSGASLYKNKVKLEVDPATNWLDGTNRAFYIYHQLTDKNSNRLRYSPPGDTTGLAIIPVRLYDNSAVVDDEIIITFRNMTGGTIAPGTSSEFYLEVGV